MKLSPTLSPSSWQRLASALVLCTGPFSVLAQAQEEPDAVYLSDGSSQECKILEESWLGVTLQPEKGPKKTLGWSEVRSIEYADAPPELAAGLAALAAGNADNALEMLTIAQQTPELRPVIQQTIDFNTAFCLHRLGKTSEATTLYAKVLTDHPKGRYLRMIGENLIDLHLASGDAAGARATLDKLAAGAKGLEGADALTLLLEARLLERQGKLSEAQQKFAALEASPVADLAPEGKLGRARMLLRQNKGTEAEPVFRALISESKNAHVQSGAWNGIGEMQATEGRSKKEAERIQDGLYAYLRTVVQYKPLPGESTEEYERALAGAATCFEYLSQLEPNAEKKKLWRDRQRERLEQLQQEYPASTFLKK